MNHQLFSARCLLSFPADLGVWNYMHGLMIFAELENILSKVYFYVNTYLITTQQDPGI